MFKKTISGHEQVWIVKIGDSPSISFKNESEAISHLINHGQDFGVYNAFGKCDACIPVIKIRYYSSANKSRVRKYDNRTVYLPVQYYLLNGKIINVVRDLDKETQDKMKLFWEEINSSYSGIKFSGYQQYLDLIKDPETYFISDIETKPEIKKNELRKTA